MTTSTEECKLTKRQKEILQRIVLGYTNPEIAEELHLTVNTVKTHICDLLERMRVENRTEAAAKAVRELGY